MDTLSWLLEPDPANPGVRYTALRKLLHRPAHDPDVIQAQAAVMTTGPVPAILSHQSPDGSWPASINGYKGAAMQVEFLAELGADPSDERVQRGARYLLEHVIAPGGGLAYALPPTGSKVVHCHSAMQASALIQLGLGSDPRLLDALEWQAQAILGELPGDLRYYKSGTSGPGFSCGYNAGLPCGWGATKALCAFLALPAAQRSPTVQRALEAGAEFLLAYPLAQAAYPNGGKVSPAWFRLGFPFYFWSDILETAAVLVELGYRERITPALDLVRSKQDAQGRWALESSFNGKMWVDIEAKGQPSKWVTLRALSVLQS